MNDQEKIKILTEALEHYQDRKTWHRYGKNYNWTLYAPIGYNGFEVAEEALKKVN
jgi:hypothetical protein